MIKLKVNKHIFLFVIDELEPPEESFLMNNDYVDMSIATFEKETAYVAIPEIYNYCAFDVSRAWNDGVKAKPLNQVMSQKGLDLDAITKQIDRNQERWQAEQELEFAS